MLDAPPPPRDAELSAKLWGRHASHSPPQTACNGRGLGHGVTTSQGRQIKTRWFGGEAAPHTTGLTKAESGWAPGNQQTRVSMCPGDG